jgi:hypothetical protein
MRYFTGTFPVEIVNLLLSGGQLPNTVPPEAIMCLHDRSSRFFNGFEDFRNGYSMRCIKN